MSIEIDVNKIFNAVQNILGTTIPQTSEQSTADLFNAKQPEIKISPELSRADFAALQERRRNTDTSPRVGFDL